MVPKSLKIGLCPRSYHNSATLFNHRRLFFQARHKVIQNLSDISGSSRGGAQHVNHQRVQNVTALQVATRARRSTNRERPVQHWLQRHQTGRRPQTTDEQALLGPVMKPLASNDSKNQNYETWVGNNYIVNLENRVYLSELPFCKPPMYRKCTGRTGRELLKIYWLEINLEVDRKKVKSLSVPVQ